ncbi:MAG TPA: hypothetical protein P5056_02760 [Candidatus Paceibacterota bacterium]|nr:hypothetical protein [Candidatus Paceibacterota bacterium]
MTENEREKLRQELLERGRQTRDKIVEWEKQHPDETYCGCCHEGRLISCNRIKEIMPGLTSLSLNTLCMSCGRSALGLAAHYTSEWSQTGHSNNSTRVDCVLFDECMFLLQTGHEMPVGDRNAAELVRLECELEAVNNQITHSEKMRSELLASIERIKQENPAEEKS